jgi:hypothetical protein
MAPKMMAGTAPAQMVLAMAIRGIPVREMDAPGRYARRHA